MTTRRGVFAIILGAVAAAKLKPSPAWAAILPPQPVAEVGVDELLKQAWDEFKIEPTIVYGLYVEEVLAFYPPGASPE